MIESFDLTLEGLMRDGAPIAADSVAARNWFIVSRHEEEMKREHKGAECP
jgi:hypothetical protein